MKLGNLAVSRPRTAQKRYSCGCLLFQMQHNRVKCGRKHFFSTGAKYKIALIAGKFICLDCKEDSWLQV